MTRSVVHSGHEPGPRAIQSALCGYRAAGVITVGYTGLSRAISAGSGRGIRESWTNPSGKVVKWFPGRSPAECEWRLSCLKRTFGAARSGSPLRRVEMWRGGGRSNISVAAPFVWRCLTGSAVAPFPHPAHRTGQADLPHPALGQDVTPSPTTGRAQAGSGVRARDARKGARVDKLRPCVARLCA